MSDPHVFERELDGVTHRVEIHNSGLQHHVSWSADGDHIADKKSMDNSITLDGGDAGTILAKVSTYGRPRRVSWYADDDKASAALGTGGRDLTPAPGSPAARRDELMRTRPTLYTLINTGGALAGILVPIALAYLAARIVIRLPWPEWNLPTIPLPDLPSIPWPDLPSIPWPDVAWWPPGWLEPVMDVVRWIWPLALAFAIARAEIRRRRKQDDEPTESAPDSPSPQKDTPGRSEPDEIS